MARNKNTPATVEAVEALQPEGVETVETVEQEAAPATVEEKPKGKAGKYVVQWHIKAEGKRYAPGDSVELSDELAAAFVSTGAIAKA
jgi:hypothetical protein